MKYIVSLSIYILQDAFIRKVNHYIAIYARWRYTELVGGDIGAASTQECMPFCFVSLFRGFESEEWLFVLSSQFNPQKPMFFPMMNAFC